jgi:hypothetical protein
MVSGTIPIFTSTSSDNTVVFWEMVAEVTTSGKMFYQHFSNLYTKPNLVDFILEELCLRQNL